MRCRTSRCSERLPPRTRWQLCPSCRIAWTNGALFAGVLAFLVEVVRWIVAHT